MEGIPDYWIKKNDTLRPKAKKLIKYQEEGLYFKTPEVRKITDEINSESKKLNSWVKGSADRQPCDHPL